jgi:hypothetical protein
VHPLSLPLRAIAGQTANREDRRELNILLGMIVYPMVAILLIASLVVCRDRAACPPIVEWQTPYRNTGESRFRC